MASNSYTAQVFLLSQKNFGEADKILHFFSKEYGQISAMAFGCRRAKSPLAGSLQLFNELDVTFTKGSRLDTVRQVTLRKHFPKLKEDLFAMSYASFIAELTLELLPEGEKQNDIFDFLEEVFSTCGERNPQVVALIAGWQLLKLTGVLPSIETCVACGKNVFLENDMAKFSILASGALCLKSTCQNETKPTENYFSYSKNLCSILKNLLSFELMNPPENFSIKKNELMQAEKILLAYIEQLLGKRLNSLKFLSQLRME